MLLGRIDGRTESLKKKEKKMEMDRSGEELLKRKKTK